MNILVIVEKGKSSYGAYVPDLPGCVAVGESRRRVMKLIRKGIPLHIRAMREAGEPSSCAVIKERGSQDQGGVTGRALPLPCTAESDLRQPLYGVREALYQADQQGGLGVRPGASLLPVLQGADVGAQVSREKASR